ncbi:MAG: PilN domain-containing protein [Methylobacter sp.]|nr:PilN domain-containing protein [Methylobacter sp.]
MLNLNSTIDLEVKKFLRWWKRELSFLVPENIKQLVNDKQGFIIVRPQNSHLELSYILDKQVEDLGKLDRNEAGIAQYQALLAADERLFKANIIVRLTGQDAIQKELALPAAAKENLHQVISYEIDRYTPFKAEQVYFDIKPLDVINEPGQIRVMLVLTTRQVLNALYDDIKAMGISPLFVDYEGAPNNLELGNEYYNLLPEWLRQKTAKTPRLIHSALMGATVLLLCAAIVMPVWLEYQAVNELEEKISTVEKEARNVKTLQSNIDGMIDETRKLIDEKNASPPVVVMLNALSALIKDDTWLAYAQYSDGHMQIQGESPAASALIAVLEASELFANASFVSPVTQDKNTGLERFQITFDISTKRDKVANP